jgi:3-methyladenine DNA glycosylase Tag
MTPWNEIWDRAVARHGEDVLREGFPHAATADELRALSDDRYLAAISKRVFAAGFRWRVILAKWDGFEEAFHGFDPLWVADLDASGVETLAQDTRIVRNRIKIRSTIENAAFVLRVAAEHGSFGNWLADWPADDTLGLWAAMKADGDRLGGNTGPWILRLVGRPTFRFSGDMVQALVEFGAIPRPPGGKKIEQQAQAAINAWSAESGLDVGAISVVLAKSVGELR